MRENVINITVLAKDLASKTLKSVKTSSKTLASNLKSGLTAAFNAVAIGATALVGVLGFVGKKIVELARDAGQFQSISDSFRSTVDSIGLDGKRLVRQVKEAVSGTVTEQEVMTKFLKANSLIGSEALGEQGENFERMAVIAKKAARATGQDVEFMFESIVTGVGRASPLILDNLGITVDATKVYKDYAKQLKKTSKELTVEEKKQALLNAVLEKGERIYKDVAVSADGISSSFARLRVASEEIRTQLGLRLIPAVQPLVNTMVDLARKVLDFIQTGNRMNQIIAKITQFSKMLSNGITFLMNSINNNRQTIKFWIDQAMVAFNFIKNQFISIFKSLGSIFGNNRQDWILLAKVITGVVIVAFAAVVAAAAAMIRQVAQVIKIIASVINWFKQLPFVVGIWNAIKSAIGFVINKFKEFGGVKGILESVRSFIERVRSKIAETSKLQWVFGRIFGPIWSGINALKSVWGWLGLIDSRARSIGSFGFGGLASRVSSSLGRRAMGDRHFKGGFAMVGERGPELVQLPKGSQIFSNPDTQRMVSDKKINITNNFSSHVNPDIVARKLAFQINLA